MGVYTLSQVLPTAGNVAQNSPRAAVGSAFEAERATRRFAIWAAG
jgi:hypothetical protein